MTRILPAVFLLLLLAADCSAGDEPVPETWADRTRIPSAPADADVFEHLANYPGATYVVSADGTKVTDRYGDPDTAAAEKVLGDRIPRPVTVDRLLDGYRKASEIPLRLVDEEHPPPRDEEFRAALLHLLAASRDRRAVPLLGAGLGDEQLDVRVAATYALLHYWTGTGVPDGGTESAMFAAAKWWDEHQSEFPAPPVFAFESGGAHHIQGYGEWRVRLSPDGELAIEHDVRGEVTDHGVHRLEAAAERNLRAALDAAKLAKLESSSRPGVPDEAMIAFILGDRRSEIWANDVRESEALAALIKRLGALIENLTGSKPVLF